MEQTPTISSSATENPSDGYFDSVYSVFRARQHPLVLVEECALGWMGQRVFPQENLDLLVRSSELETIVTDLVATGRFERVEQNLKVRFSDTYTRRVPRLRLGTANDGEDVCVNLWSEHVYMLHVDGEKIHVPESYAWNAVVMEERFDLQLSWAQATSIGYSTRMASGVRLLPQTLSQSAEMKYPFYIATIPRMLDALLDQARYRVTHADDFPGISGNRPIYHVTNFVRYLHLEKPHQRERLLPELAERNREMMEAILDKYKRKPLFTLSTR